MSDTTTTEAPPTVDQSTSDGAGTGNAANSTAERARERSESIAIFAAVFAAIGVLTSLFAVGLAVRAVQTADEIENPPAAVATEGTSGPQLTLTEFKITPNEISVPADSVITIVNDGTVAHDVMVDGIMSDQVDAGGTTTLDLTGLAPGTYDMICTVTGHKDSGMTGTITVT